MLRVWQARRLPKFVTFPLCAIATLTGKLTWNGWASSTLPTPMVG